MTLSKQFVAQIKIFPLLKTFCTLNPVKIDVHKLSESTYPALSLLEIAWLQSISEMNYNFLELIDWESPVLLAQVEEIQTYLFLLSQNNEIEQDLFDYTIEETQTYMLHTFVSPKEAIAYFDSIKLVNRITDQKIKKDSFLKGIRRLELYRLATTNLTYESLKSLRSYCKNNPVTLIPTQLPESIWLKELALYLAISAKGRYEDYGDIDYDDKKLLHNRISIHRALIGKLQEILGFPLGEWSLMLPEHQERAKREGILDIAAIATNSQLEVPDYWSFKVSKELALRIYQELPEFNYLFDGTKKIDSEPTTSQTLIHQNKRSKNIIRAALEIWVRHLIEADICTTYTQFKQLMINTYYKKTLRDEGEEYDEGPIVKNVYCLLDKNGKDKIYFKIENQLGVTGSTNNRALSSFKQIFDNILSELKKELSSLIISGSPSQR
ncbi:hypothetical protein ACQUW5_05495 [Legionella sp. CNM-1927-20]|uniref:hypothetical protein n=1 Tax=Legionella sp. CNM-1927-20 TaxID=3422221 RepID=UPI00403B097F